jgi:hypothetical protein
MLKKFDKYEKRNIDPASTILITASRRSGKTYYAKYLVKKIKNLYSLIICFTNTKNSGQWNSILDNDNIIDGYDPEIIEMIYKRNRILKQKAPKANRNVLIIFDDVIDNKKIKNDDMVESLFIRGRHDKIGVIFITQKLTRVSPTIRENSDIIIVPIQKSRKALEALSEEYGVVNSGKDFINLINYYTKDYNVFVIRNDKNSNDPDEISI